MAGLHFPITADNGNFMRALHEVASGVRDASRQIEADGGNIDRTISRIKTGLAGLGAGIGFKEITGAIANTRGEFQQLEVAFKTMLGSEEEATRLMSQMIDTAAKTPFGLQEVSTGAKQLLAFGLEADKVNETLIRLGDISAGLGTNLGDLVYLYGTTMAQGRLYTQDLNQFTGRGIPMIGELAKQFGVAESKVKELVEAGKVGFPEVQKVIESLTNQGGKFGGLMEEQSKTISGQISNIEDAFDTMLNEIGKSQQGLISGTLDVTSTIIENWQTILSILGDITVAYGVQKAVLALDAGFTKAATNYGYDAEIKQLKALIPLKEEEKTTALQQAVASGDLTEAKAAEIKSLREEAEAYVATLAAKQAEAKQAEIIAQANLTNALQEKDIADGMVEAAQEKWKAAYDSADAIAEEAAAQELETAKAIQSEAADAVATATKEAKAASSAHVTAQQATESASTQINTAQTAGNTAATGVLTIAKEKLAIAIGKVNAAIKANQFAIITGAIIAMGYAVYKLITYQTEAEKIAKAHEETTQNLELELEKENERLEDLNNTLKTSKKGSKDWKEAKDELVSQYGKYLNGIDSEIERVGYLSNSYKKLTEAVQQSVAARQIAKFQEDNAPNHDELIKSITEKLSGEVILSDPVRDKNGRIAGNSFRKAKIDKKTQKQWIKALIRNLYQGDDSGMTPMLKDFLRNNKSGVFSMDSFGTEVFNARKTQDEYDKDLKDLKDIYGYNDSSDDKIVSKEIIDGDELDKKIKEKKSELAKYKKNSQEYKKLIKEIKKLEKERSEWGSESDLKSKGPSGSTAAQIESKQTEAHQKLIDLMKQQAEERLRLQKDYEYQQWQNRIDLMAEGEAKVLEQMRLDQSKERTSLEDQKKQAIQAEIARQKAVFDAREDEKAAGNKKYAKQVFDPASIYDPDKKVIDPEIKKIIARYDALNADLLSKQKKAESDRLESAREAMNNYLKEFGDYSMKRRAIAEEYAKKIKNAQSPGERLMYKAQQKKEEADLDFEEWQKEGGMSAAFGNLQNLSRDMIDKLIFDMEKYRSKVIETFDTSNIEKYEEALLKLRDARVEIDYDGIDISEGLKESLSLAQQLADKNVLIADMKKRRKEIVDELINLQPDTMPGTIATGPDGKPAASEIIDEETNSRITELKVNIGQIDDTLRSATNDSRNLESQLKKAGKVRFADIDKLAGQVQDVAGKASRLASIFDDDVADAIGDGAEKFGEMYDSVKDIISGFKSLTTKATDSIVKVVDASGQAMSAVSVSATSSLKTIESASAILAIIGAAIQLATIAASLFDSDKKHEKNIEALQDRIDALNRSYDSLNRTTEKLYSADKEASIRKLIELKHQEYQATAQQMAEEQSKRKADADAIKGYQDKLQDLRFDIEDLEASAEDAIFGDEIKSQIENFADAYSNAWEGNEDRAQSARDMVREMMRDMVRESIKAAVQGSAAMEHIRDSLTEFYADGVLDQAEQDYIYGLADRLQKELDSQFGWADSLMTGDKFSQEASSRGFSGMSQDTGDELNGRFTALQESNERIAQSTASMMQDVSSISSSVGSLLDIGQDMLNIQVLNNDYLSEIARNSRRLSVLQESLSAIERKIKNM